MAVGQAAPAFSLPADDGSTISLADLKGQNVVIYFYPKDMTPGCTVEACGFRDSQAALRKLGAVVLGVSKDSVKTHQKFKVKEKLNFPLLSDETGEMIAAYGSWGPKTFMGRKFDGILRTTVLIDKNGKVAKIWPKVDVKVHAAHVLEALAALG
ncbi:MAG: thioredoxin-dependent thiol peroxidase [Deltaproteobacteria bacterium]|nr:thioredoxin-dependent thiol peroxidase [Deltaproteobacteria bacterium]